jgi:hypothetical protein
MNLWTWFAIPSITLVVAYCALGSVSQLVNMPTAAPVITPLHLPEILAVATNANGYRRGGAPKDIRLSAFGVVVQDELTPQNMAIFTPPAKELFMLQSVLINGANRSATIDGQIYREGETVQRRYVLSKVEQNAVWLKGPRGRELLPFPEFKDPSVGAPSTPTVALQAPGKPALPNPLPRGKLDAESRKILEMLKL